MIRYVSMIFSKFRTAIETFLSEKMMMSEIGEFLLTQMFDD